MKKFRIGLIVLGLAATAAVTWWYLAERKSPGPDLVSSDVDAAIGSSPDSATDESIVPTGPSGSASKSLSTAISGTATESDPTEAKKQPAATPPGGAEHTFLEQVEDVLERQELALAYPAAVVIAHCRMMSRSNDHWELVRERMKRVLEQGEFPRGEELHYRLLLIEPERRLADCQALREWGQDAIEAGLRRRADSGDAYARFLFAMWPPYEDDTMALSIDAIMEYEKLALRYTLRNLEDGHPLGLLALGLSYSRSYFTPHRGALGAALLLAAQACSNGVFQTDHIVEMYMRFLDADLSNQPSKEDVVATGLHFHDRYCATSISRSND